LHHRCADAVARRHERSSRRNRNNGASFKMIFETVKFLDMVLDKRFV
jgi:hypothetical protein